MCVSYIIKIYEDNMSGRIYTIKNVKNSYYKLLEQEYKVDFPQYTKINEISLICGKDYLLNTQITIQSTDENKIFSNLDNNYIDQGESKIDDINIRTIKHYGEIKIYIHKKNNEKTRIDLIKYDISSEMLEKILKNGKKTIFK